ncbi:hypothetical protein [Gordonia desulfuricans]|uniref:hypothetical protein n=1 Tax=Gordonia desulfuricans TaxID=89051 RepID=UPI0009FA122A|nr:hypothetical protein [Gordonia desulfuricans]
MRPIRPALIALVGVCLAVTIGVVPATADTAHSPAVPPDAGGRPIVGLVDAHAHLNASAAFGGSLHCGRPFDQAGPQVALAGCPAHARLGVGALLETIVGGSDPTAGTAGWPTMADWPRHNTLLHEQAYYTGIERAWRGGLRMINTLLVANRVICELYPQRTGPCDETSQIRAQATQLHQMQSYIDSRSGGPGKGWFRIVTSPAQARAVAAAGKLAVSVGVESSEILGCSEWQGRPGCTAAQIDSGLDELRRLGVSNVFLVHKFDNALGGTRFDPGTTGAALNVGNLIATGHWWQARSCTGGEADHPQPIADDGLERLLREARVDLPAGTTLPVYPAGPICNIRGLTDLGRHAVESAMDRGMLLNIDHMSVRTARDVLDIAKRRHYAGILTAHTWSDRQIARDVLALSGFAATYAYAAGDTGTGEPDFLSEWRADSAGLTVRGYGYGSDVNGLAPQAPARLDASSDPLRYPFTAINGVTMDKAVLGTRTYDLNRDGVAQYGLYADWYADLLQAAGSDAPRLRAQLMSGAEGYVRMWESVRRD